MAACRAQHTPRTSAVLLGVLLAALLCAGHVRPCCTLVSRSRWGQETGPLSNADCPRLGSVPTVQAVCILARPSFASRRPMMIPSLGMDLSGRWPLRCRAWGLPQHAVRRALAPAPALATRRGPGCELCCARRDPLLGDGRFARPRLSPLRRVRTGSTILVGRPSLAGYSRDADQQPTTWANIAGCIASRIARQHLPVCLP